MKATILLTLALLAAPAGDAGDFFVQDGKLIWQHVYESNATIDELHTIIINSGLYYDIVNTGDKITFRCGRIYPDPESMGYDRMAIPMYVGANDVSFFCTLQSKEGKYRVTVENIILTNRVTGGLFKEGKTEQIETYAIDRKGEFKRVFLKEPTIIYNTFLTKLLAFSEKSYIGDDW